MHSSSNTQLLPLGLFLVMLMECLVLTLNLVYMSKVFIFTAFRFKIQLYSWNENLEYTETRLLLKSKEYYM